MGQALGSIGGSGGSGGASGGSLASVGLSTYATMLQASGTSAGYDHKASQLERAAEYGDVKATQTNASMTRDLATTLGNIDAVRAAAHADPNSPTGAAIRDNQERIGIDQKLTAVGNINAQSAQQRADAAYYRNASSNAMLGGVLGAGAGLLKAIAPIALAPVTGGASLALGALY